MTNEELKKKIAQIIADYFCPQGNEHKKLWGDDRLCYSKMNFAECECVTECVDALIAAGIGDVSELKKHRVVVEKSLIPEEDNAYVLPNIPPTVKQLYSGEEVEKIVKEREEYKHRAEVAERALDKATELAYTYRTENDTLSCSSCSFFDSIFDRCKERGLYEDCSKRWKEELLQQAEKELAEEKKSD